MNSDATRLSNTDTPQESRPATLPIRSAERVSTYRRFQNVAKMMLAFAIVLSSGANVALAQSGTVIQGSNTQSTLGSGSASRLEAAKQLPVAMDGYCSVCIMDMRKWVRGNPNFAVVLDGKRYLFPGEEQKQMFLKNPVKYTPALGGDCIVCFVDGNARMAGTVNYSAIHKDRLYLFPSEGEKTKFMAATENYENADLAFGGACSVCRVEMQKQVAGSEEFATLFNGKRYYFPGLEQKKMFLANPKKYSEQ